MGVHYDGKAGFHANRKSLASIAANIEAEEKGGVNQRYFYARFVRDNEHSEVFFRKVCREIGDLENKEINEMLKILKEGVEHEEGTMWIFDEEKMYEVLISNPICKKVCEKQKYKNWTDLIMRFS